MYWWSQGKITTFSFVVSEKGRVVRASGHGIKYVFLKKSGRNFSEMLYEPWYFFKNYQGKYGYCLLFPVTILIGLGI